MRQDQIRTAAQAPAPICHAWSLNNTLTDLLMNMIRLLEVIDG